MKIKLLSTEFKKLGVLYKQVKREKYCAIYSLSYTDDVEHIIGFDVVAVQSYTPDYESPFFANRTGEKWESIETYPTSESFGSKAWSFDSLEDAEKKFEELTR